LSASNRIARCRGNRGWTKKIVSPELQVFVQYSSGRVDPIYAVATVRADPEPGIVTMMTSVESRMTCPLLQRESVPI
jgi:hypothetical protein